MLLQSGLNYMKLGQITQTTLRFYSPPPIGVKRKDADFEKDALEALKGNIEIFADICKSLGLKVSSILLSGYIDGKKELPRTVEEFQLLVDAVHAELRSVTFVALETQKSSYYSNMSIIQSEHAGKFPKATMELFHASNSYAFELDTACVFHCMRAVELGLRSVGKSFGIEYEKPIELMDWADILNPIQRKIKALENTQATIERDSDLEFYSHVAAQFQYFKQGWRHRTMHARADYSAVQAKIVLEHAISFFEILSTRLSE